MDKNGRIVWKPRRVVRWEWGEEPEQSFESIKRSVVENAVFGGEEHMQYHLATDASKTGIGGVLYQLINTEPGTIAKPSNRKQMHIIMFMSFRLVGAPNPYSARDQEALANLWCLQEVRWLVLGS